MKKELESIPTTMGQGKQAERVLLESRANMSAIIENTTDSIWAVNTSYEILYANAVFVSDFYASFGVHLEPGVNLLMALPEPLRPQWKSRYDRALSNERFEFVDKIDLENSSIHIEVFMNPIIIDNKVIATSCFGRDITKRKQTEQALAHSHDLMRYIIEHNRSAVAVHDKNMKYIYVSQRYLDDYKVKAQDIIGRHHYDIFPDLPQKWRDVHQRVLAGEVVSAEDDSYVREDGSMDWTRWECRPWYEADGSIGGLIVYTEIITERKRAEEALRESERKFRNMAENIPGMVYQMRVRSDDSTYFSYVSPRASELFGLPAEQNSPDWELGALVHPDDRDAFFSSITQSIANSANWNYEGRLIAQTGESKWFRGISSPAQIGEELVFDGILLDITEHKRAENALRASEEENRLLVQNLLAGVVIHAPDTQIIFANGKASNLLGLTNDQMMGKTVIDPAWYFVHEDGTRMAVDEYPVAQVLATRAPIQNMEIGINRPVTNDRVWVLVNAFPEFDSDGRVHRIVVIFLDITERMQSEEALRHLSTHDTLTGIFNRSFFETELARLNLGRDFPVSIVIADLDNMKTTNDTMGHAMGDELLKHTAQVLQAVFRAADIIARIGGDEFAVLLPRTDSAMVEQMLARVHTKLSEQNIEYPGFPVQLSLGAATAEQGKLMEAFIIADRRMYADKAMRKSKRIDGKK